MTNCNAMWLIEKVSFFSSSMIQYCNWSVLVIFSVAWTLIIIDVILNTIKICLSLDKIYFDKFDLLWRLVDSLNSSKALF